jgi:hypothetical protein
MWDLWWTKWHWRRFPPSTSVSPATSFHRLSHTDHLLSGAGTISQLVTDVPSGLSFIPPQETKKKSFLLTRQVKEPSPHTHAGTQALQPHRRKPAAISGISDRKSGSSAAHSTVQWTSESLRRTACNRRMRVRRRHCASSWTVGSVRILWQWPVHCGACVTDSLRLW